MNRLVRDLRVAIAIATMSATALATHVVTPTTSGHVVEVKREHITVDKKTYRVKPGSSAAQHVTNIKVGDWVDLWLDTSAGADAEVIEIHEHADK